MGCAVLGALSGSGWTALYPRRGQVAEREVVEPDRGPGDEGEGWASGLRVRVLVTPSCLGDGQERGRSQPVAGQAAGRVCSTLSALEGEGKQLVTGEGIARWRRQGVGDPYLPGWLCVCTPRSMTTWSLNSMNHPELPER